ncbi:MAG: glycosyltransferase family 4 protein [Phycisphaerales bacterium]
MPNHHPTTNRRTRVLFAAGNGDVGTTLRRWSEQASDTRIMAEAYSAQIYALAAERGWRLFCFPNNPAPPVRHAQITTRPLPKAPARGVRFLVNEFRYGYSLAKIAQRLEADLIIVATGMHPIGHAAIGLARIPVIVSLHNTFWARGESPPAGLAGRILRASAMRLNQSVRYVVAVSEEIRRQTIELWNMDPNRVAVHVPQYRLEALPWQERANQLPHTILFAGRLEAYKGVDDILQGARILEDKHPGRYRWFIAGDGPHLGNARKLAADLGIDHICDLPGQLDRSELTEHLKACYATITPTRPSFKEGLAKLPLEGAIVGRPAIVSTVVPALDLLGDAAEPVKPSDPQDIARAVHNLSTDPSNYKTRKAACKIVRNLTSNSQVSFKSQIAAAADAILTPDTTG